MRLVVLSALLLASAAAHAQSRPVSAVVKATSQPQFGLDARLGERISVRALTAFATDFGDTSVILNLAGFYRLSGPGSFGTRVGASLTTVNLEDVPLFGGIVGADYALSDRFGVFGEVALDVDTTADVLLSVSNTGVGVRVGL